MWHTLLPAKRAQVRPEDVPVSTPIRLPNWVPPPPDPSYSHNDQPLLPLVSLLQSIHRVPDLSPSHLAALRLHLTGPVSLNDLIPDLTAVPDLATWDTLAVEQVLDEANPRLLRDGARSPSCHAYVERRTELSCPNPAAFRTIRRLSHKPGRQLPRLGNSYDFFRCLEALTRYWDDPTNPPPSPECQNDGQVPVDSSSSPPLLPRSMQPFPSSNNNKSCSPDMKAGEVANSRHSVNSRSSLTGPVPNTPSAPASAPARAPAPGPAPASAHLNLQSFPRHRDFYSHAHALAQSLAHAHALTPAFNAHRAQTAAPSPPRSSSMTPAKRPLSEGDSGANADKNDVRWKAEATDNMADPGDDDDDEHYGATWRTENAKTMPPMFLRNLVSAFVKVVAFQFGCSTIPSRGEPRLHLTSPSAQPRLRSFISSNCQFVFRTPSNRIAARSGVVEGPLAAISIRNTTSFDAAEAEVLDLAREVVGALITAQHRAREGRVERRFGEGQWWSTKPRWGGVAVEVVDQDDLLATAQAGLTPHWATESFFNSLQIGRPNSERYPAVRPPSSTWDAKTRYCAIGRDPASTYDDVFVISSVLHHISILRFRVPLDLLDLLDGSPNSSETTSTGTPSPDLRAWRSEWFDLFVPDQRIVAFRTLWAVLSYLLRPIGTGDVAGAKCMGSPAASNT